MAQAALLIPTAALWHGERSHLPGPSHLGLYSSRPTPKFKKVYGRRAARGPLATALQGSESSWEAAMEQSAQAWILQVMAGDVILVCYGLGHSSLSPESRQLGDSVVYSRKCQAAIGAGTNLC
ncbi:hypothetical protein KIL84_004928 [Mauremys mutica]|uniref:Uncharacterized protein n=1 Tax=Mauremys mutica TaxID=74926 RepID=A0A9D4B7D0_9SAUR|nr:hypothetical protein KIL84_004928 [Mauremys mutica]